MQKLEEFRLPKGFRGKNAVIVQLWWLIQATLFRLSPQFLYGWRRFLLRLFGANIGKGVIIRPTAEITYPWKVIIGNHSWIGDDVTLYSLGQIEIGMNTVVSQKCYLCTGSHDYSKSNFPIYAKKITIEDSCWIATDVYIAPGVTIGNGSVVGARSSVFKSLEANKVYVGSPAKFIKNRKVE